jgi:predicted nucleic acid-binding protein
MILEACLAAKANFLITGDKDLLQINGISLKSIGLRDLKILTPRDFLSAFK